VAKSTLSEVMNSRHPEIFKALLKKILDLPDCSVKKIIFTGYGFLRFPIQKNTQYQL